ncbi:MAG: hypothetical protein U9Q82_10420, partial [Chloroflexota bacterium]|nr:hypothetical protein [Chloroflexota bacterium]
FDLWWYLSQPEWPEPNLELLNQALVQSEWKETALTPDNWRGFVRERIEKLNWQEDVSRDIQAFLISAEWDKQMGKEELLRLL